MNQTWWVSKEELIDEQALVIALPLEGSYLIIGPPGSGKTNLLLLRANYVTLAGHPNIALIVFTRTLQEFIVSGANQYDFPPSKVMTCLKWQQELLRQYGATIPSESDFETRRRTYTEALWKLITDKGLTELYDFILLDEAQDYLPSEMEMFARLAKNVFVVADSRQKIYEGEDSIKTIQSLVDKELLLRHHFRNGIQICRLADAIARDRKNYEPLEATSNYDEADKPSTVEHFKCKDIDEQINRTLKKLELQLKAYPEELLGVCCPRNAEVDIVWEAISKSPMKDWAVLQKGGEHSGFGSDTRICVSTFHAAKGLEFRAVHLVGTEYLRSFSRQRNMAFTAVTRAKTTLSIYHTGNLPSFLEGALAQLGPLPDLPDLGDVFGEKD